VTWNWHAGMPVASYLVEDSVGNYSLTSRVVNGIRFYQAQDLSISAAQRAKNLAIMDMQPDITAFESQFNGPFPFASDGIIIGTPARFDAALRQLQRTYGGSSISERELEAVFHRWLPVHSGACRQRLGQIFSQWFDTAYPAGGGANRPAITGPGLAGPGFYAAGGTCA
jgi:hypothetical protein